MSATFPIRPDQVQVSTFQNPPLPSLQKELEEVTYQDWDINDVNLEGVDLKHPSGGLIRQTLKFDREREQWIYDFKTAEGSMDIIQISPQTPNLNDLLNMFSKKHTHSAPEVRLILGGEGVFTIYDQDQTREILVKRGSFIILPKGCVHTFQLTDKHQVSALRVFRDQEGWKPNYVDEK